MAGESDEETAVREVREETGFTCELGPELASTRYTDSKRRPKTVRYWAMGACEGRFEPHDEVDEIRWVTPDEARPLLSYARDLEVLDSLEPALLDS